MENIESVKKLFESNEFTKYSSMEFVNLVGDDLVLKMVPGSHQKNIYGMIHGGELFSLLDTASGLLCFIEGMKVVTLNSSISFISNVPVGEEIFSKTKMIHKGRKTAIVEATAYTSYNKILAKGTFTFYNTGEVEENIFD
ncbi:PaaI family thioesterase [Peptoniphilus sp. MSJ-1]|uniref:PaaI family thioesterase n=1 Tax=Peptoniphilus ovalis TaxID=2841503 RepID=A0ABS6FGE8_9FIRM|nr:PaaI family thioesterase [Peptoniphilus ovalis]MBU5668341.1 PaaI family thioesterase [Peptoniphilus ovalis]